MAPSRSSNASNQPAAHHPNRKHPTPLRITKHPFRSCQTYQKSAKRLQYNILALTEQHQFLSRKIAVLEARRGDRVREVEGQKKRGRDWSLGARLGFGGAGREPPGGEEGEEEGVRGLEREIAEFEERVGGLEVMRKVAARMKRECETELANAPPYSATSQATPLESPSASIVEQIAAIEAKIVVDEQRLEFCKQERLDLSLASINAGILGRDGEVARRADLSDGDESREEVLLRLTQIDYSKTKAEQRLLSLSERLEILRDEDQCGEEISPVQSSVSLDLGDLVVASESQSAEVRRSLIQDTIKLQIASLKHRISGLNYASSGLQQKAKEVKQTHGTLREFTEQRTQIQQRWERADEAMARSMRTLRSMLVVLPESRAAKNQTEIEKLVIERQKALDQKNQTMVHIVGKINKLEPIEASSRHQLAYVEMNCSRHLMLLRLLESRIDDPFQKDELDKDANLRYQSQRRDDCFMDLITWDKARQETEVDFAETIHRVKFSKLERLGLGHGLRPFYNKWTSLFKTTYNSLGFLWRPRDIRAIEDIRQLFVDECKDFDKQMVLAKSCAAKYNEEELRGRAIEGAQSVRSVFQMTPPPVLTDAVKEDYIKFFTSPDIWRGLLKREELPLLSTRIPELYHPKDIVQWMNEQVEGLPFSRELTTIFLEWAARSRILFKRDRTRYQNWLMRTEGFETVLDNNIRGPQRLLNTVPLPKEFELIKGIMIANFKRLGFCGSRRRFQEHEMYSQICVINRGMDHRTLHDVLKRLSDDCELFIWSDKERKQLLRIGNKWPSWTFAPYGPLYRYPIGYTAFRKVMILSFLSSAEYKREERNPYSVSESRLLEICNATRRNAQRHELTAHMFHIFLRRGHDLKDLFLFMDDGRLLFDQRLGWFER